MDERGKSRLKSVAALVVALALGFGLRALIPSPQKAEPAPPPEPIAAADKADEACCQAEAVDEPKLGETANPKPGHVHGPGVGTAEGDGTVQDQRASEERALATLAELAGRRVREQNPVDVADTVEAGTVPIAGPSGGVLGRVAFVGAEPEPRVLEMATDPTCLRQLSALTKLGAEGKLPPRLVFRDGPDKEFHAASWVEGQEIQELDLSVRGTVAHRDVMVTKGALADVFVWVEDLPAEPFVPAPDQASLVLDQRACAYDPYVLGVRVGQSFAVLNSDPTMHNVHARAQRGEFNMAMPKQNSSAERNFQRPQVLVPVVCEVHTWMRAFIGVVAHPHFAITGPDGRFDLPKVPIGKHTLAFQHPTLGKKTMPIDVKADDVLELNASYKAP